MRKILFRGKRVDTGEWVYGYLSKTRNIEERPAELRLCIDYEEKGVMCSSIIIPETVGQYTGLTDIKGKMIFEGDILSGSWKKKLVVYFDECYLQFRVQEIGSCFCQDISYYGIDKIEIIGNIYNNPELIEVK